ncbi:motility associated factor glycosyltransferase family protein [Niallia sp. 01092]|uniref:motility associated factor glycosyltransferase family protein n=1 Tax=unclassified Niallia TaxID=2837522 RepID=UPI003FD3A66F
MKCNFECVQNRQYPTVKVNMNGNSYYLHSRYNPILEAEKWAESITKPSRISRVIVIGVGAGYHIHALKQMYPKLKVDSIEFNEEYLEWCRSQELIQKRLRDINVLTPKQFTAIDFVQDDTVKVVVYQPALKMITNPDILQKVQQIQLMQQTIEDQSHLLSRNFHLNIQLQDSCASTFVNIHPDEHCILVSAGPSLTKQLPILKKLVNHKKVKICCVGTALTPLLKVGIIPDYVMVTDPKINIVEQFDFISNQKSMILFYLSTANHEAVVKWPFQRFIILQNGYEQAEKIVNEKNRLLVNTGGSVATTFTDLLVKLGASNIIFVGQDLAFTNGFSHADDTHNQKHVNHLANLIKVKNYDKTDVIATSKNLLFYLRWFENYVKTKKEINFFNCTEGGAHIDGLHHIPFQSYINMYL